MASIFQPPPTYALPVVVDEVTGRSVFNPIWLRWFLDLSKGLSAGGTPSGAIVGPPTSIAGHVVLWDNATGSLLRDGGALGSAAYSSTTAFFANPQPVTITAIDYTVLTANRIVKVTAAGKTITLPTAVAGAGRGYIINNASTGICTVVGTGGQTINAAASQVLPASSSMEVYSDGANWQII